MPPVEEEYGDEVWAPLVLAPVLPQPPSKRSSSLDHVWYAGWGAVGERGVQGEHDYSWSWAGGHHVLGSFTAWQQR